MGEFDSIRPYTDQEVPIALQRIMSNRLFPIFVRYFLNEDLARIRALCSNVHTVDDFQVRVMKPLLKELMQRTTAGFTASGFNRLQHDQSYLFISNHRDIVLDAAWLDVAMNDAGIPLMEITFGSNLMSSQFNIDLGRINRMFKLVRGGNLKDFYKSMLQVSHYMRHVITDKGTSVWIAQRNGRTKNGDDQTEVALLKMLAMSSKADFVENLSELNICPVAVSYEYEPCDFLKTSEVYVSRRRDYIKGKNEDMNSIKQGLLQFKGHVHFEVLAPISPLELSKCAERDRQDRFKALANLINQRIYQGYRLHTTNYIAYDMLHEEMCFTERYSQEEVSDFVKYMEDGLSSMEIPSEAMPELREIFLSIYSKPVENALRTIIRD